MGKRRIPVLRSFSMDYKDFIKSLTSFAGNACNRRVLHDGPSAVRGFLPFECAGKTSCSSVCVGGPVSPLRTMCPGIGSCLTFVNKSAPVTMFASGTNGKGGVLVLGRSFNGTFTA